VLTPYPPDYEYGAIPLDYQEAWKALAKYPQRSCRIVTAYPPGKKNVIPFTDKIARFAYHHPGWVDVLVLDECQRLRVKRDVSDDLAILIDEGRHVNLNVWAIGRRPIQTPMLLRSQCQTQVSFRQNSQRDIVVLEDYYGDNAEKARTLGEFEFLRHDDDKLGVYHYSKDNELINIYS